MSAEHRVLPEHVAIIMDRNRTWARKQGLKVMVGHEKVVDDMIEPIVDSCIFHSIKYLTLWAFSTENWERPPEEVMGLMNVFRKAFNKQSQVLFEKGVRLRTIGDMSRFPKDIQEGAEKWTKLSEKNTRMNVTVALNYGGRDELIRAMKKIPAEKLATITEAEFSQYLDTKDLPDVDLVIRTGGEQRTSGFMPWQSQYAEYYFPETPMPEFTPTEFELALDYFSKKKRNFGK